MLLPGNPGAGYGTGNKALLSLWGARAQVTIHTDTLNESGCVEQSIGAFKGRTIHTYHRYARLHTSFSPGQLRPGDASL